MTLSLPTERLFELNARARGSEDRLVLESTCASHVPIHAVLKVVCGGGGSWCTLGFERNDEHLLMKG